MMELWLAIVLIVVSAVVFAVAGVVIGMSYRKKIAEKEIGSAEQEANRIISDAMKTAEAKKKEAVIEGKDEIHRLRNEADKDINERRKEVQRQERRIQQKEESLDKKMDQLERKEDNVNKKLKDVDNRLLEVEQVKKSQFEMLEKNNPNKEEYYFKVLLRSLKTLDKDLTKYLVQDFYEYEKTSDLPPYTIINGFKNIIKQIQDKIKNRAIKDISPDIIYDICMISTNGNTEVSEQITNIYKTYGIDVFIDVKTSNDADNKIKVYDGLTIDEGYSDPAYINTKDGTCSIRNARVYYFADPIDTPDMVSLFETIIFNNIIN